MGPLLDALPEPLLHGVQAMPHPVLQSAFDGLYPPGDQWYWRAGVLYETPPEAAAPPTPLGAGGATRPASRSAYPPAGAAPPRSPPGAALWPPTADPGSWVSGGG